MTFGNRAAACPVEVRLRHLSPERQRLVNLIRKLHYGRIENLVIKAGEPVLERGQPVIEEYKFGGEPRPLPTSFLEDCVLKQQFVDFFQLLDQIGDGLILSLEFKGGLPFKAETKRRV